MHLYQKTAAELSRLLQQKACSAEEILLDVQARIRETEDAVGAILTYNHLALAQARTIDTARARGEQLHPLAGIPLAVKDNIVTKDLQTTCGSMMLDYYIPPYDATVAARVKDAGMLLIAKTNMDEFGMGSTTETSYRKVTHNPWDLTRTPGGSSGGSAAAVMSGEAPLALGTDTGGSIRQPAAFCGAVGLKPTYGSVSRYGLIAYASSFDQIGPLARTVEDAALLLDLIWGHDSKDATSVNRQYPALDFSHCDVKGCRIGIPQEYFGDAAAPEVKQAVQQALQQLEQQGAILQEIHLPYTQYALQAYYILASAEASSNLARYDGVRYGYCPMEYETLTELYQRSRSEGFGDEVKRRIMLGTFVLRADEYDAYYHRAKLVQRKIRQEFDTAFQTCDVLVTPTTPTAAFPLGMAQDPVQLYQQDLCTVPVNLAGLPAISVPCGKTSEGLPIGMQLIGNAFSEPLLLRTAYVWEQLCQDFGKVVAS